MKNQLPAMDPIPTASVTDDELNALLDGQLSEAQRSAFEARLAQDADTSATFQTWRQHRDGMRDMHRSVLREPIPQSLLIAARQASYARHQLAQWQRWGGMAAGVMLAFGVGWLSHGQWQSRTASILAKQQNGRVFVHQAAIAHLVYSPEVRHPVEVSAAQQEHLVQWLSKRLGKSLKVPDLSAQGFELVGGRLLPGDEGARAQFMFQNAGGERITLYLGLVGANNEIADSRETAFRYSFESAVPGFYWIDRGFGYALSGKVSRALLLQLAEAVYGQL